MFLKMFKRSLKGTFKVALILSIALVAYLVAITCYTSYRAENDLCCRVEIIVNAPAKLKFVTPEDINLEICKQLIYHKNKWMSKSLRTFIEYVKEHEFA